jgi:HAD superfamily hydrolase (TIGR01509 family)
VKQRRLEHHHGLIALETVRPGVVELVEQADDAGVALGVASSSPRSWVEGHLDRLGLRPHFRAVRTRDDVPRAKPDPAVYRLALEALGADPARSVALEDSHHGVSAAKAAGMWAVACPNRITTGLDFSHADLVVDSLADVDLERLTALLQGSRQT